jgi:competence ComEA-like helix-hairpin-helix protein
VGAAATAAATDIPEWLLESAAGEAEFEALEGQAEIAGFSEELPDWLRRVDEYSTETAFKGTGTESELPDWLLEVQETPESLPGEEIDLVMAKAFPAEDQPESIFETEEPILGDTQPTRIRTTVDTTHLEGEIALEPEPETEAILDEGVELEGMAEIEEAVEIEMADVLEVVEEVELAEGRVEASEIRVEEELEEPVALKVEAELEEAAQLEGEAPIVLEAGIPEELIPVETIQDVMEAPAPALQGELDEAFAWLMALQAPSKSVEAPDEAAVESSLEIETSALEPEWGEAPVQLADEGAPEDLSETEGIEVDAVEQDARIETVEESRINAESILAELDAELIEQEAEFEWLESLAVPAGEKEEPAVETEAPLQTTAEDAGVTFDESLETEPDVTYRDVDEVFANPAESGLSGAVEEAKSSEIAEAAAEETSLAGLEMVETPSTRDEEIETVVEIGTPEKKVEAEIPDLPDWLSEAGAPSEELEWAPPPAPHRRYELNLASFNEIEALPGIGTETARKMIEYREQHGPFHLIEDLLKIPGFGLMTLEGVRDYLYVEYAEPEPVEVDAGGLPEIEGISTELGEARSALTEGNLSQAMDSYARIIASNQELDLVARDLEEAAYRFPEEADVWQNLGDAYLRLEQVQAALKSYIKAEQLLR